MTQSVPAATSAVPEPAFARARMKPSPYSVVHRDGTARLLRFTPRAGAGAPTGVPVLLVPSLINRWYVLDLRDGSSLVQALVDAGFDTWCLDWGAAEDEDRYLTWRNVLERLHRAARRVSRDTGHARIGTLGYCMGATLTTIFAALHPERTAAVVNLAGPIDFSHAGLLGTLTDAGHFDVDAISDAGNVHPLQMQSGFTAMRPSSQISKWIALVDRASDPDFLKAFQALETWANDNIAFPAEAYRTYIDELYQRNLLVQGQMYVGGERVDLGKIVCPVLVVVTQRDTICPPPAATALIDLVGSTDTEVVRVPGGHVGGVVGSRAPKVTYPAISRWFAQKLRASGSGGIAGTATGGE